MERVSEKKLPRLVFSSLISTCLLSYILLSPSFLPFSHTFSLPLPTFLPPFLISLSLTPSLLKPLLFSSLPISQRSWGVPIPVFYKKSTNEALMNAEILEHVEGTYYLYGML